MSMTRRLAKSFSNYENKDSGGSKLRARRLAPFLEMVEATWKVHGEVKVIDVGGRENYWNIVPRSFLEDHGVEITIVNIPDDPLPEDHGIFRFRSADGCDLSDFGDSSFHIAHSNSVLEHVGDWQRMRSFAEETARVATSYFVQTPNFWFPVEPHCMTPFFHWLPKPVRVWLVRKFQLGHWPRAETVDQAVRVVERARLVDEPMFRALFPDAEIEIERYWGLRKSFVAVKR